MTDTQEGQKKRDQPPIGGTSHPQSTATPDDINWLAVLEDETWSDFVARMRSAPHIKKANQLAVVFKPDHSFTIELQQYMSAKNLDKTVTNETHLPKVVALLGVIQSYRERVSSTQIGLMDMERNLKRAWKECEAWLMLHPYMNKKKDSDRKRSVYLILQELEETLGDIQHLLKAAEAAVWTLKQAADSYGAQRDGLTTMIYAGMRTGATPEKLVR